MIKINFSKNKELEKLYTTGKSKNYNKLDFTTNAKKPPSSARWMNGILIKRGFLRGGKPLNYIICIQI